MRSATLAKAPTKKTSPKPRKKPVKAARAKKPTVSANTSTCIQRAPDDKCFWVNHGPVVGTLAELRGALKEMTDDQFRYHALDREVNDFAAWIEEVLGHTECAKKIVRAKNRSTAVRALAQCGD